MNWEEVFKNVDGTLLNSAWLSERSNQELIEIIQVLASQVHDGSTITTAFSLPGDKQDLIYERDISFISDFATVPANSIGANINVPWRVVFFTDDLNQPPIGLELIDNITIGRTSPGRKIDLNLSLFGGDDLGVSRIHASIRPTEDRLLLYDLGSSNGTFQNFEPVPKGVAAVISDGGILSFGLLHLKIKIVQQGS